MMDLADIDGDNDWHHYDISFLTTMRLKQEQKNLNKVLKQLEKQRKKSLEMFQYEREQTEIDLEQRVLKRSTSLSELSRIKGKKESIAISRRESLNVLRAHNGYVWNNALGRPTYGKMKSATPEPVKRQRKLTENTYFKEKKENDRLIQLRNAYFRIRPQTTSLNTEVKTTESLTLPSLTRGYTDLGQRKHRNQNKNELDMDFLITRWIALSKEHKFYDEYE